MRFYLFLVFIVIAVALIVGAQALAARGERVSQPIAFNHQLHLSSAGLTCLDCHTNAMTAVRAGLPGASICFDCHDIDEVEEAAEESTGYAALSKFADSDQNIPWRRVALARPDVFFSHRRHTAAGGIDCLRCHVDQTTLTSPPARAELVMSMETCIACHQQKHVTADCLACHR